MAFLDIKQESIEPFVISCETLSEHANINGMVHGGVLFYISDDIIGRYVTHLGRKGAAADSNIHYYRPAILGKKLYASIEERKIGRRLATFQVVLKDEDGRHIADSLFTVAFEEEK